MIHSTFLHAKWCHSQVHSSVIFSQWQFISFQCLDCWDPLFVAHSTRYRLFAGGPIQKPCPITKKLPRMPNPFRISGSLISKFTWGIHARVLSYDRNPQSGMKAKWMHIQRENCIPRRICRRHSTLVIFHHASVNHIANFLFALIDSTKTLLICLPVQFPIHFLRPFQDCVGHVISCLSPPPK